MGQRVKNMPEQRFRIAPTSRGAIFRAKRWFYAAFHNKTIPKEIREMNRRAWTELAGRMVEEVNKYGFSDNPTRLTIRYETGPQNEFKPLSATLEIMSMEPIKTITISTTSEITQEREQLKKQLEEILKRAKDLGIDLKEIVKPEND